MENKIWNELSEESKEKVLKVYKSAKDYIKDYSNSSFSEGEISALEQLFGKDNLYPRPEIKTWDDVITNIIVPNNHSDVTDVFDNYVLVRDIIKCPDIIKKKLEATYRIGILIDLAYGGLITDEEWTDNTKEKFGIVYFENKLNTVSMHGDSRELIAFHTAEQRDKFLKYNKQLCKDYYTITT